MKTKLLSILLGFWMPALAGAAAEAPSGWRSDVRGAFATARAANRPLLVDLTADWCGWCRVMEQRVFPAAEFRRFAESFVLLRVDVEDRGDGTEIAARYDSSSLPTLLMLEPSGALIGMAQGFAEAPELVQQLKAEQAIHARRLSGFATALEQGDVRRLEMSALDFYGRNDGERAAALFARLLEVEPPTGSRGAWARYFLADSLRMARRFADARAAADAARVAANGVDDVELTERVALLPFWISRDAQRCADASGVLSRFAADHPGSVLLPGARNALERLRGAAETCS